MNVPFKTQNTIVFLLTMLKINKTFTLRSIFICDHAEGYLTAYEHDPIWRQTVVGCLLLNILKDMFGFNVTYQLVDYTHLTPAAHQKAIYPSANDTVDIYIKPMELQIDLLDYAYPIQSVFMWRLGFILRREPRGISKVFYTQPFSTTVWICVFIMILIGSSIFYTLSIWDTQMFQGECSFTYELLLAFSAYCQHILPLQAISCSRRIGYLTFILCAFVVHCFYTSNLLSHLVSDGEEAMDLYSLAKSNYNFALLKDMRLDTDKRKYEKNMAKNLSIVWMKLLQVQIMNLTTALDAVIYSNTALVTEYITLYPILKRYLDSEVICQLVEIDIYSNVKQYFFTSKHFSYKEEIKIGTLRAKEAGLMRRILALDKYSPLKCEKLLTQYKAYIEQTFFPLAILFASYFLVLLILIAEKIHYRRNRVWPYTE